MGNMFPQELWNTTYSNRPVVLASNNNAVVRLLRRHLPQGPGHALELGCCPGAFLGHLGLMGYTMHGIDLSPSVHAVGETFRTAGLLCGDFLNLAPILRVSMRWSRPLALWNILKIMKKHFSCIAVW